MFHPDKYQSMSSCTHVQFEKHAVKFKKQCLKNSIRNKNNCGHWHQHSRCVTSHYTANSFCYAIKTRTINKTRQVWMQLICPCMTNTNWVKYNKLLTELNSWINCTIFRGKYFEEVTIFSGVALLSRRYLEAVLSVPNACQWIHRELLSVGSVAVLRGLVD